MRSLHTVVYAQFALYAHALYAHAPYAMWPNSYSLGIVCGASVCMLIEAYAIRCLHAILPPLQLAMLLPGNGHVDEHTCIRVYVCMQATPTSTDTHVVCCVAGNGHVDCATILLRVGANVNHQNNHGLLLSIYVYLCIYVYVRTYVSGHSCL